MFTLFVNLWNLLQRNLLVFYYRFEIKVFEDFTNISVKIFYFFYKNYLHLFMLFLKSNEIQTRNLKTIIRVIENHNDDFAKI